MICCVASFNLDPSFIPVYIEDGGHAYIFPADGGQLGCPPDQLPYQERVSANAFGRVACGDAPFLRSGDGRFGVV